MMNLKMLLEQFEEGVVNVDAGTVKLKSQNMPILVKILLI